MKLPWISRKKHNREVEILTETFNHHQEVALRAHEYAVSRRVTIIEALHRDCKKLRDERQKLRDYISLLEKKLREIRRMADVETGHTPKMRYAVAELRKQLGLGPDLTVRDGQDL